MYSEKFRLDGKTAFITGGGRGIGLCAAQALAEAGARVVISDVQPDVLEAGRAELAGLGHAVEAVALDVTCPDDVTRMAGGLNARYGAIDVLVANAGIAWPDTGGEEMSDAAWLRVVDVDLNGVFWCCRDFGRHMLARGSGAIVTVGSMSGLISNRPQRQAHYNAAKAGVHHLTRSLAGEWAAGPAPRATRSSFCIRPRNMARALRCSAARSTWPTRRSTSSGSCVRSPVATCLQKRPWKPTMEGCRP